MKNSKKSTIFGMGGRDTRSLYKWALAMAPGGCAVEIGSYLGNSAAAIVAAIQQVDKYSQAVGHLYCVDTWHNDGMTEEPRDTFGEFTKNTKPWRSHITPLRGWSTEVAQTFEHDIDFLLIDGDHSYEGCRQDIIDWFPKVRLGGICVFHDYPNAPGVVRSTDELFESGAVAFREVTPILLRCVKIQEMGEGK